MCQECRTRKIAFAREEGTEQALLSIRHSSNKRVEVHLSVGDADFVVQLDGDAFMALLSGAQIDNNTGSGVELMDAPRIRQYYHLWEEHNQDPAALEAAIALQKEEPSDDIIAQLYVSDKLTTEQIAECEALLTKFTQKEGDKG